MLGVTVGHYKYPPFQLISGLKAYFTNSKNGDLKKFTSCAIPKISEVIKDSHAFIGHAYGAPSKSLFESHMAENAYEFIDANKSKLQTITFTGDVFDFPSLDKWKRLYQETNENLQIFIAPGNHDLLEPAARDVFQLSPFGQQDYPFLKYLDTFPVIFDDSTSSYWQVSIETIKLVNNQDTKDVIVARHNMPTIDLLDISNQADIGYIWNDAGELETIEALAQRFNEDTSYYWIIGDSGAFPRLPRLSCLKFLNHTFIANGLGEVPGDSVLLFSAGNFYQYEL